MIERTFVMIKPDGVKRGLIGEVIKRFEQAGLKIVGLKMYRMDKEEADEFYPADDEWFESVGNKTLSSYNELGIDAKKELGTDNPKEIGKMIKQWLLDYVSSGPVILMVLEGNHAIKKVRDMIGSTIPIKAQPGTIRGDFSVDSADWANIGKRAIMNIVHASDSQERAEYEIKFWFKENELYNYKRLEEYLL
ncbi:MAG: nucleoside-diphosphate kinase [Candidatus Aenigmarchaeota archaeon]|nr:nucleoside-diphosphate kinase [Candidatus Aenigmarchaeota archaeon]